MSEIFRTCIVTTEEGKQTSLQPGDTLNVETARITFNGQQLIVNVDGQKETIYDPKSGGFPVSKRRFVGYASY